MFERSITPTPETHRVFLDGQPVTLPVKRRTLSAIRAYLESLALQKERVLCVFSVDGCPAKSAGSHSEKTTFTRIEGHTVGLADMPLRMLDTALRETVQARSAVESAVALVMINEGGVGRELWWELARKLKEPLLTLSLLPDSVYQPVAGCASLLQLRKWQLQQLAAIMNEVDDACWTTPATLSNALENRVLPWLEKLQQTIFLWHQTVLAGLRLQTNWDRDLDKYSMSQLG